MHPAYTLADFSANPDDSPQLEICIVRAAAPIFDCLHLWGIAGIAMSLSQLMTFSVAQPDIGSKLETFTAQELDESKKKDGDSRGDITDYDL